MSRRFQNTLAVLSLLMLASGCAVGRTIEYRGARKIPVAYEVRAPLTLGVLDRRDVDLDADNWVGLKTSASGIPVAMTTASGRPFSTDLGEMLAASLVRFGAKQVVIPTGTLVPAALGLVKPEGAGSGVLISVRKWETMSGARMDLTYDVGIEVIDAHGAVVATASRSGSNVFEEANVQRPTLDAAISSIFEDLFAMEPVRLALSPDVSP